MYYIILYIDYIYRLYNFVLHIYIYIYIYIYIKILRKTCHLASKGYLSFFVHFFDSLTYEDI